MTGVGVAGQLKCQVITPEKQVVDREADFVILTTEDGQMGILPEHAAVLCRLAPGMVRIDANGQKNYYFVNSGFAEVLDNRVTILTPEAIPANELDPHLIAEELAEAERMTVPSPSQREIREKAIRAARAKRTTIQAAKGDKQQ
jgi:F-type H+-transporting ATPase subunit epsilon